MTAKPMTATQVLESSALVWTLNEAVMLCTWIESICPKFGCHVALTGGLLYKGGPRKDCDILFYRIRQVEKIESVGLFIALQMIGINKVSGFGWCVKCEFKGKAIDCFFPEETHGTYVSEEPVILTEVKND